MECRVCFYKTEGKKEICMYCRKPKCENENPETDQFKGFDELVFQHPQTGINLAHIGVDSFNGYIHTDRLYYVGIHPNGIAIILPKNQPVN